MSDSKKTHYRKAFNSPYLSSADVVGPTVLTIAKVTLEQDRTKKTKDYFNTAHFAEKFIREGEPLKPMILNATNSKAVKELSGSHFIEDWKDLPVTVYVDNNVRFGRETMEGLRISHQAPAQAKPWLTPQSSNWEQAKKAYLRDGNLNKVLQRAQISDEHKQQLIKECQA